MNISGVSFPKIGKNFLTSTFDCDSCKWSSDKITPVDSEWNVFTYGFAENYGSDFNILKMMYLFHLAVHLSEYSLKKIFQRCAW